MTRWFATTRDRWQWIQLVLSMPGVVGFFLPFTWGVSPIEAATAAGWVAPDDWKIRLVGLFMGLALVTAAWQLRRLIAGALSRRESAACIALSLMWSALSAALVVYVGIDDGWPDLDSEPQAWVAILVCWLVAAANLIVVIRHHRRIVRHSDAAIVALMAGYFPNAFFCLAVFWGGWQIGASVVLLACACYAFVIVATATGAMVANNDVV